MSDERDDADAAAGGGDNTAALTQPLRPTTKRSRQSQGGAALAEVDDVETTALELGLDDEADYRKAKAAKGTKGGSSRNPFVFVWTYLGQVVAELRKVIWPNRKQMVSYTTVVLVYLVFMVTLIGAVDLGWAKLVLFIFGNK